MDQKLTPSSFTNIFKDSLSSVVTPLPQKAFDHCIKNYEYPYLSQEEKDCVKNYSQRYFYSMDYVLINFSKKLI
jgi:hypothetical protein